MDLYLTKFTDFLKEKTGNKLAGVLIYGSYVRGYFDPEKSDYDVFVIFKDEVVDIKKELNEKFPKVSLQLYMNLSELKAKIVDGGWNTYIALTYTGQVLYSTPELEALIEKIKMFKPDVEKLTHEQKESFIKKLKADTEVALQRENFELNKFLYHSLTRKLQVLNFVLTGEIVLEFNDLLDKTNIFSIEKLQWLKRIESAVRSRDDKLLARKDDYINVLRDADKELEQKLFGVNV